MRKIYIHCGLHKTGTTSLQLALSTYADVLKANGYLYPKTGRIGDISGQHNIAWQLGRDRRFDQAFGDIDGLIFEVGHFDGDIILSSEDFESSLTHPERWSPLLTYARSAGRSIVFIIYLRNQVSYLESLNQHNIKHHFGEEYIEYANEVIRDAVLLKNEWKFQFDYERIVDQLSTVPDTTLKLRNYHALLQNNVLADFCEVVGIRQSLFDDAAIIRANARKPPSSLLGKFYRNRIGRKLRRSEKKAVLRLCECCPGKLKTTGELLYSLENKFFISNARLCKKFDLPDKNMVSSYSEYQDEAICISMQRFFSFETQVAIKKIALLLESKNFVNNRAVEVHIRDELAQWKSFVRDFK